VVEQVKGSFYELVVEVKGSYVESLVMMKPHQQFVVAGH
jgi:hypothetical protein